MADDIEADDFMGFDFGCDYGSEAASVVIKDTGKRGRNSQDSYEFEESTTPKKKQKVTSKSSKFIKDKDELQAIRTSPTSDQVKFIQSQCNMNPSITGKSFM